MKRDAFLDDEFDQRIRARFAEVKFTREMMHKYQDTCLDFLRDNPYSALFIDMGMGKTVTCGTLIAELLMELVEDEKILIIGPLRVATDTWPTEFTVWQHLAPFDVSVIHADEDDPRIAERGKAAAAASRADNECRPMATSMKAKEAAQARQRAETQCKEDIRVEAVNSKCSIHIISRDWVEWLVARHDPKKNPWPYRTIFIDESSSFKDISTNRFKALKKVRDAKFKSGEPVVRRMHLLTATPAAETYEHLFAQIYLIDGGKRFGSSITNFRERYFTQNKYTHKWKLREGAEEEILAKCADICLVMKQQDYLNLPEPQYIDRTVHMSASEMALYAKMAEDSIVELPDGTRVEAETAAALSQKLLQMASGVLYETMLLPGQTEEDDFVKIKKIHSIHEHKLEALKEIVEEAQGQPILVGYHHRASLDRLLKTFPKAVKMDKMGKCIKEWNKGNIPILLMHPQSGGHGLNLQAGGHIVVFYDIPWSLELYMQFIRRLARQGQKMRVLVYHLVTKGTLDAAVVQALQAKEDAQEMMLALITAIKAEMKARAKRAKKQREHLAPPTPIHVLMTKWAMEKIDAILTHYEEAEAFEAEGGELVEADDEL